MANIDPVIAEILKSQGRLEAQVEMLMCKEEDEYAEDEDSEEDSEKELAVQDGPALATNPAMYSNQLEFDIPPIF